jgi:hypothetical protein
MDTTSEKANTRFPLAICRWCRKSFQPIREDQRFCPGGVCRIAYNNWIKTTGIHYPPCVYNYIKSIAEACNVSVNQKATEMMLKLMDRDESELPENERPGEYSRMIEGLK